MDIIKKMNFFRGLAIIYAVGLVGHIILPVRPMMISMTPYVLLITGGIVILPVIYARNWRVIAWFIVVALTTFFMEVAGIATGRIFGIYSYTDVMGIKAFGVPLLIGFNWVLIIFGSVCLAEIISRRIILKTLTAALCPPLLDFVIEPVAVALNYWHWGSGTPPLRNYLAWGVISGILSGVYFLMRCKVQRYLPAFFLLILFIYFVVLNFIVKYLS